MNKRERVEETVNSGFARADVASHECAMLSGGQVDVGVYLLKVPQACWEVLI